MRDCISNYFKHFHLSENDCAFIIHDKKSGLVLNVMKKTLQRPTIMSLMSITVEFVQQKVKLSILGFFNFLRIFEQLNVECTSYKKILLKKIFFTQSEHYESYKTLNLRV